MLHLEGVFIVCCNAGALPMHRLLIYRGSTQRTAPEVHSLAVAQCSSRRRDGNTTTATYRNAAAVDYERTWLHCNKAALPIYRLFSPAVYRNAQHLNRVDAETEIRAATQMQWSGVLTKQTFESIFAQVDCK